MRDPESKAREKEGVMNHGSTLFGCSFRRHGMDGAPFDGIKLGKVGLGQMDCKRAMTRRAQSIIASLFCCLQH